MKLVLDSSVLIDHLRGGHTWNKLLDKIEGTTHEIFIPTVVIFELYSGKSSKDSLVSIKIKNLLQNFEYVELSEEIARGAGELYRDISHKLDVPDYIIAASALEIGGEVMTLNRKHFEQIPHLKIYPI